MRLEADPAWNGMQRLDLRLVGVEGPGAVQLEVMRGGYISGSKVGCWRRRGGGVARSGSRTASGAPPRACMPLPLSSLRQ